MKATTEITISQLNEAVAEWLERRGIGVTDSFSVDVKSHAGDRPFDSEYTTITLRGIVVPLSEYATARGKA